MVVCALTACQSLVAGVPAVSGSQSQAGGKNTDQPTIALGATCNLSGIPAWKAPKAIGQIPDVSRQQDTSGIAVQYRSDNASTVFVVIQREAVLSGPVPETDVELTNSEYASAKDKIVKSSQVPVVHDGKDYNVPGTGGNRVAFKTIDSTDTQLGITEKTRTAVRVCNGYELQLEYTDIDKKWSEATWQRFLSAVTLGVNVVPGGGETYVADDVYGYYRVCNGVPVINAASLDMAKKPFKVAPLATYDNLDPARAANAHWTETSLEFGAPYVADSSEPTQVNVVACFKAVAGTEQKVSTCNEILTDGSSVSADYFYVKYELTFYEAKTAKELRTEDSLVPGEHADCHTDPNTDRNNPKVYSFPTDQAADAVVRAFAG
jgi:hypothetical protein